MRVAVRGVEKQSHCSSVVKGIMMKNIVKVTMNKYYSQYLVLATFSLSQQQNRSRMEILRRETF